MLGLHELYPGAQHFYVYEMACPCGCGLGRHEGDVNPKLIELLEAIRAETGRPLFVNSACRCPAHNRAVGGVDGSVHELGDASDLRAFGGERKFRICRAAYHHGARGVGTGENYIHVDVHDGSQKFRPTAWGYK